MRSDPSYLYPEELADDGIGEKIRLIIPVGFPIIPAGLRGQGYGRQNQVDIPASFGGRGYGRQNQADYTRWLSRARVWEAKTG